MHIPVLLGTVRQGANSRHVANWLVSWLEQQDGITTELLDPQTMQLPNDDEGQDLIKHNQSYRDAIVGADGLVVVVPEYNHGYPGSLKRVLELLLAEYIHKPVCLCGVSAGGFGGTRVIENLLPVLRELGLITTFTDINVSLVEKKFDPNSGELLDEQMTAKAEKAVTELRWMAETLKWGRENVSSKYHQ